jgi:hypothetical protein
VFTDMARGLEHILAAIGAVPLDRPSLVKPQLGESASTPLNKVKHRPHSVAKSFRLLGREKQAM